MQESHFSRLRLACSRLSLSGHEQKDKKWKEERWRVFERLPLSSPHVLLSFISRARFFWPHWTNTITSRCSGIEPAFLVLLGENRESSGNRVYFPESLEQDTKATQAVMKEKRWSECENGEWGWEETFILTPNTRMRLAQFPTYESVAI